MPGGITVSVAVTLALLPAAISATVGINGKARYASQGGPVQGLWIRLAIDQQQVGPDVAITMILPLAKQQVVVKARRQYAVHLEYPNNRI
jgi:hypothetical protein